MLDFKLIEEICEAISLTDEEKYHLIIREIAKEESAIKNILLIIEYERKLAKELKVELNSNLSMSISQIETIKRKGKHTQFIYDKVIDFYKNNKFGIKPTLNLFGFRS